MKRLFNIIFVFAFIVFLFPISISAKEKVDIYFFYGSTCPHCAKEKEMLYDLADKNDNIIIHAYEVYNSKENQELMKKKAEKLNTTVSGVPFTIIEEEYFVGYSETYTKKAIIKTINNLIDGTIIEDNYSVDIPLIGNIETKKLSLPVVTILMGVLDGFNPCAMWILLFLISILITMKEKKKRLILGSTFIMTSTIIYFLFMVAWLNFALFVGATSWIKMLVAFVAITGGIINLKNSLFKKDSGCSIVSDKKRVKMFDKIKKFTSQKSFMLSILGIIALAISVNVIELLCSAGLPVIYTQILALNNVSTLQYYLYIMLYMIFFMFDDMLIFIIAMSTLKLTGISTKYSKISHIVGGILMIIIGLLLIFNPGLLMFN